PGPPWQTGGPWLRRMHGIITAALAPFGVVGELHAPACEEPRRGVLCFHHFTPGDLMIGDAKVVGSAQRKYRGARMQHGSILLARSEYTPSLPGIRELCGRMLSAGEVYPAVCARFTAETGWRLEPGELTAAERERVEERAATKYSQ